MRVSLHSLHVNNPKTLTPISTAEGKKKGEKTENAKAHLTTSRRVVKLAEALHVHPRLLILPRVVEGGTWIVQTGGAAAWARQQRSLSVRGKGVALLMTGRVGQAALGELENTLQAVQSWLITQLPHVGLLPHALLSAAPCATAALTQQEALRAGKCSCGLAQPQRAVQHALSFSLFLSLRDCLVGLRQVLNNATLRMPPSCFC